MGRFSLGGPFLFFLSVGMFFIVPCEGMFPSTWVQKVDELFIFSDEESKELLEALAILHRCYCLKGGVLPMPNPDGRCVYNSMLQFFLPCLGASPNHLGVQGVTAEICAQLITPECVTDDMVKGCMDRIRSIFEAYWQQFFSHAPMRVSKLVRCCLLLCKVLQANRHVVSLQHVTIPIVSGDFKERLAEEIRIKMTRLAHASRYYVVSLDTRNYGSNPQDFFLDASVPTTIMLGDQSLQLCAMQVHCTEMSCEECVDFRVSVPRDVCSHVATYVKKQDGAWIFFDDTNIIDEQSSVRAQSFNSLLRDGILSHGWARVQRIAIGDRVCKAVQSSARPEARMLRPGYPRRSVKILLEPSSRTKIAMRPAQLWQPVCLLYERDDASVEPCPKRQRRGVGEASGASAEASGA